jgi:iron complex transport system ATP-binding protein
MAKPELLILDEPCAGLDPLAREHFLGLINRIAFRRGSPSLVLVTHHVEEITSAFSHALVLRAGQVVAAGPLATALTSDTLSQAFGAPMKLLRRDSRLQLALPLSVRKSRVL